MISRPLRATQTNLKHLKIWLTRSRCGWVDSGISQTRAEVTEPAAVIILSKSAIGKKYEIIFFAPSSNFQRRRIFAPELKKLEIKSQFGFFASWGWCYKTSFCLSEAIQTGKPTTKETSSDLCCSGNAGYVELSIIRLRQIKWRHLLLVHSSDCTSQRRFVFSWTVQITLVLLKKITIDRFELWLDICSLQLSVSWKSLQWLV